MLNKFKKTIALILLCSFSAVILSGCLKKGSGGTTTSKVVPIQLVYYKLFDNEDVIKPMIQQFQATHPNVTIKYKKFNSSEDYYKTILNELAEGEGPDIFSVPNYWLKKNARKISPMPAQMATEKQFNDAFVSVAAEDLIFTDPRDGAKKIFGLPLAVDTLALYYNNDLYQDRVPARGRPAPTWNDFKDDVYKLTKEDKSFERFEVAGTAMGRSDNIARAMDVMYLLMLQYKVNLYNDNLSQAEFAGQQAIGPAGTSINPATEALSLYTSFGLASQKNYSWNEYMVESDSDVKEMEAFARGKVATIFGYSYLYTQIKDEIEQLKKKNVAVINPNSIKISAVPQVFDPATSTEKRDAFANYFAETVSRNSANSQVAWEFLMFITSKDNLAYYNQKTHAPTSRRDLIDAQMQDPIYGVFAEQVGYAESLIIDDWDSYKNIFGKAISSVIATTANPKSAVQTAQQEINLILPAEGILNAPPVIPVGKKTTTPAKTTTTTTTPAK